MSAAPIPGAVTVAPRALAQVVRGVVRDLLGTPVARTEVHVEPATSGGLRLQVATLVPLPGDDGLVTHLHGVRAQLAERVTEITGRDVGAVDLRVTGLLRRTSGRVR